MDSNFSDKDWYGKYAINIHIIYIPKLMNVRIYKYKAIIVVLDFVGKNPS